MILNRIKIRQKIYILGGVQLALMTIMGLLALSQMDKIGKELVDIAEKDVPLTGFVTRITEHQLEQSILFERALFSASLMMQDFDGGREHFNTLKNEILMATGKIENEISETKAFVDGSIEYMHDQKGKDKFKEVLLTLEGIEQKYSEFGNKVNTTIGMVGTNNLADIAEQAFKVEALEDELRYELINLLETIQQFTVEASLQAEQDEQIGIRWIGIAFVVALIIGSILPTIIARSITIPINILSSRLAEISNGDGDLTVSLNDTASDETGDVARAFNKFVSVLRVLIRNTNTQADVLGESSEVAMKAMRETLSNVETQRAETEMVAAAITEMSTTTQSVAESAANAADATKQVKSKVTEGRQGALETQQIIKQLSEEVTEASEVIKNLVEETNSIGTVLESIQGIAAQTNLLALNAAIEAARAGESGRGFAVVADEVRTLAQRTQISTVDIQELLLRLKTEAKNAVTSMNKGNDSALACLEKSARTSQTFEEASDSVAQISDLNIQIAVAAEEQSAVAEEINKNLDNISRLAAVTADGAKSTSDANSTIAKKVIDLHTNLNVFVV